ncbi:MAG: pyridoxal phosphate-dependent aminotransferase [Gemmatimonadaceae bacterium]
MTISVLSFRPAKLRLDSGPASQIGNIHARLHAAQRSGRRVFRFESEEPNFTPPPHVIEAVCNAARDHRTRCAPIGGMPELRAALADKVRKKNGMRDVRPDDIFVTNGASQGLYATFVAILEPGEEVILPDPMWPGVADSIRLAGGEPVGVPLRPADGYTYCPEAVELAITRRTRAIFVNTPHNPTGSVLPEPELRTILEIARRHDLWVVSDEVYEDVVFAPSAHQSIGACEGTDEARVISVFSFSASHAMTGFGVGYIVCRARPAQERVLRALRATSNGVDVLAQLGALAAVSGDQAHVSAMCEEYRVRRNVMMAFVERIPGVRPLLPKGTFYLWASLDPSIYQRLRVKDAAALSSLLSILGMGSAPGTMFGRSAVDAIRLSFCCGTDLVCRGSLALRQLLG